LLEEVFELNMALDELRDGDESVRGQLTEAREKFLQMRNASDAQLHVLFTQHDASPAPATLKEIRAALDRRRYVSNLVRDVEKELHVHASN
jgi:molecular chaperone HscB